MNRGRHARAAARRARLALLVSLLGSATASPVLAHKPSDSYLTFRESGQSAVDLRWDIAVRDLEYAVGVDRDGDGQITWGELRASSAAIRAYSLGHLQVALDHRPCVPVADGEQRIVSHSDGAYFVQLLALRCPGASTGALLSVDYSLLFDLDPQHRGIARLDDGSGRVLIFDADRRHLEATLARTDGGGGQLRAAIRSGVHHIWTGYDHLLFLLALLLPSVLCRHLDRTWTGVRTLRTALGDVARVVTAFTVAHSITLTLAALGLVSLPSRLVESLIAASVLVAAVNNLRPFLGRDRWVAAFALGLLHGFGFSATLNDVGLTGRALLTTLFGFNLGVELGQLALVALFVPLAFAVRNHRVYRRVILLGGSATIGVVALVWLVERAGNVALLFGRQS